jgi:hypothetical protein
MRTRALLLASWLAPWAPWVQALDSGHFQGLEEKDLAPILQAFETVKVHYLVTPEGNSIVTRMGGHDPKVNGIRPAAIFLYFNPADAEGARAAYEKSDGQKAVVKSADATKILRGQFARRDAPPSTDPQKPDFVIFLSWARKIDTIEFLARKDTSPITTEIAGRRTAVAFLSRARAIEVQTQMRQRGAECERIGVDEKLFMRLVAQEAGRGTVFHVYGY